MVGSLRPKNLLIPDTLRTGSLPSHRSRAGRRLAVVRARSRSFATARVATGWSVRARLRSSHWSLRMAPMLWPRSVTCLEPPHKDREPDGMTLGPSGFADGDRRPGAVDQYNSALRRLHDVGRIVIQPGAHCDRFRLILRVREFSRQIEQQTAARRGVARRRRRRAGRAGEASRCSPSGSKVATPV